MNFNLRNKWRADNIKDEWFYAHFQAAGSVHEWLSPYIEVKSSRLLDFGCGDGIMALSLALRYKPQVVLGVDVTQTWPSLLNTARREIGLWWLPANLHFKQISPGQSLVPDGPFDAVFSWSTFEHVDRSCLLDVLDDIYKSLRPSGLLFIQIEPLFYSPFGSHLGRFGIQPWAHLLLSEDELKEQVMSFTGMIPAVEIEYHFHINSLEDYKHFIFDEYKKLNQLTAEELIQILTAVGFEILRQARGMVNLDVPPALLKNYRLDDLLTNEINLLAKRPN